MNLDIGFSGAVKEISWRSEQPVELRDVPVVKSLRSKEEARGLTIGALRFSLGALKR